jgi:putative ABC transport system substrate-binding protein
LSRVAILGVATGPGHGVLEAPAGEAARRLGIEVYRAAVREPADYDAALKSLAAGRSEAIMLLPDPTNAAMRKAVCAFALEHRLPAIGVWDYYPQAGCLMSYGPVRVEIFRRAAYFIDKILKGTSPAEIPIEQPTRYELVVNARTAAALGLQSQTALKARADRIVEPE